MLCAKIRKIMKRINTDKAFSLVEILIVVCILGILAAIVAPNYTNATTQAKEAAAKKSLQILRTSIQRYAIQHNEIPPGYANGDAGSIPLGAYMVLQFTYPTNIMGQWSSSKSAEFCYGPYMNKFPTNPFNNKSDVFAFKDIPVSDEWTPANSTYGWLYVPQTKTMRINTFGTDSAGIDFQNY